jgi:hypothetical protein
VVEDRCGVPLGRRPLGPLRAVDQSAKGDKVACWSFWTIFGAFRLLWYATGLVCAHRPVTAGVNEEDETEGALMLHITGKCLGVTSERRGNNPDTGQPYVFETIHVIDGVDKVELDVARDFRGPRPDEGEFVVLDVLAQLWRKKSGEFGGLQMKALARNVAMEEQLTGLPAA